MEQRSIDARCTVGFLDGAAPYKGLDTDDDTDEETGSSVISSSAIDDADEDAPADDTAALEDTELEDSGRGRRPVFGTEPPPPLPPEVPPPTLELTLEVELELELEETPPPSNDGSTSW